MTTENFEIRYSESGAKEIVRTFNDLIDSSEDAEAATARLGSAVNNLRRQADPAQRSFDRLAGQINILARAEQAGIITAGELLSVQNRLTISAQSQLQPINSLVSTIQGETQAWKASTVERNAALASMRQINNLQKQGVTISNEERESIIRANLALAQQKQTFADNAAAKRQSIQDGIKFDKDYTAAVEEDRRRTATAIKQEADTQASAAARIRSENESILASFNSTFKQSGNSVETAMSRQTEALNRVEAARARGLITSGQVADAERRIESQYAEQIDPLQKLERLQRERINYMSGLAAGGRQLGLVNADLARLDQQGIVLDQSRVRSLKALATQADKLAKTYESVGRAKTLLGNVLGGFGIGLATAGLAKSLDTVTLINNRLALVSSSQQNANTLFAKNVELAAATRSDLTSTVEGFSRIARSTKQIGLSQQAALDLTKSVNQALKISGASAQEASATVVQFGQALSSNRLGGDELRSVLEQAPRLSQAIVDGINLMNRTDPTQLPKKLSDALKKSGDINIGTLRTLAKQGLITTKVVSDAVLSQQSTIDAEFARTVPTIADSFSVLNTRWLEFLNNFNKGTGAGRAISQAILFVANNLDKIASVALVVGTSIAGAFIGSSIQKFLGFVTGLPGAFSASSQAINGNTVSLNSENAALARNTQLQIANAESRLGVGGAAKTATAGRQVASSASAVGSAVSGVASAQTTANLTGGAAAAATMRANLIAAGNASTGAAVKTGILASVTRGAASAGGLLVQGLSKLAVFAGILGALIGLYITFKDAIHGANDQLLVYGEGSTQKAIKGTISLGDTVAGVWNTISGKVDTVTQSQIAAQATATEAGKAGVKELSDEQIKAQQEELDRQAQTQASTLSVYANMKDGAVKATIDIIAATTTGWKAFTDGIAVGIEYLIVGAYKLINALGNVFIDFYNTSIVPVLNAGKSVGIGGGATTVGRLNTNFNAAALAKESGEQLKAQRQASEKALKEGLARSITSSAANRQNASALGGLNGAGENSITDPNGSKKKKAKVDPDIAAYKSLRNELDPLAKAMDDLTTNRDLLTRAFDKGLITDENGNKSIERKNDLMARLQERYDEAANPLKKYVTDTQAEINILGLSADKRELASAILSKEIETRDKLKRPLEAGEKAIIAETEALKINTARRTALDDSIADSARARNIEMGQIGLTAQALEADQRARQTLGDAIKNNVAGAEEELQKQRAIELQFIQTRDAAKRVSDLYQSLTASQRTFAQDSNALNTLLGQGVISLQRYNRELRALSLGVLQDATTAMAGFERAIITIKNQTEDTAADIQTVFTGAFSDIKSEFQNFFQTGNFDVQKILSNITGNLAGALFDKATDPLIDSIGKAFNIPGFLGGLDDQTIQANNVYINGTLAGGTAQGFGGLGLPTAANSNVPPAANDNVVGGALGGGIGDPAAIVSGNQQAATQVQGIWAASSQAMSGNWVGAIQTMIGQTTLFQTAQTAATTATTAASTAAAAADIGIHTGAEAAKTGATVAGVTTRTGAVVAGSVAEKGATISTALLSIGANAVKAATGAYAAIASIPVVGPVLAPIAAATALAGVYALGKGLFSARDGFGDVPYDGALTELHKNEMVLPKKYADPLRENLTSGGSKGNDGKGGDAPAPAPVEVNQKIVNVLDPQMMVDAMQSTAGVRQVINIIQSNPDVIRRALAS